MLISIIISTYNQVDWLEKVLWGYACQTDHNFELVIADDGSGPETRERIAQVQRETSLRLKHVWQPDDGFQKCKILNKAITATDGEYIIISDGDCIPRSDFVAAHRSQKEPGRFLSGGYTKCPFELSRKFSRDDIQQGRAFSPDWLRERGLSAKPWEKHVARGKWAQWLNLLSPTKATWNGANASALKEDILRVNGFDERMQYGGLDLEMGARLTNLGIYGKRIRYSAILLHLDHDRGYARPESIAKNRAIRRETVATHRTWTEYGIIKGARPCA